MRCLKSRIFSRPRLQQAVATTLLLKSVDSWSYRQLRMQSTEVPTDGLSQRGVRTLGMSGTATATRRALAKNSSIISLAVAENKLMHDILEPKLEAIGPKCLSQGTAYASSWLGQPGLRKQLARLYNEHVLAHKSISFENVAVLASATSAIDTIIFASCEPGDSILTPAPYYASYLRDVEARAECKLAPVFPSIFSANDYLPSIDDFENAYKDHSNCRMLLLSNPNNPFGTIMTPDELKPLLDWAKSRGLAVIIDEVFALSIFSAKASFTSALDLIAPDDNVHIVYSCSKDLALSGFRIGCVFSHSQALLEAIQVLAVFENAAVPVQLAVEALLEDEDWFSSIWIPQLRSRLASSWAAAESRLECHGIGIVRTPNAGHFCLLDLAPPAVLSDNKSHTGVNAASAWDQALAQRLLSESGILLTPGAPNMGAERPGLFRLCHAGHDATTVETAIDRLASVLKSPFSVSVEKSS